MHKQTTCHLSCSFFLSVSLSLLPCLFTFVAFLLLRPELINLFLLLVQHFCYAYLLCVSSSPSPTPTLYLWLSLSPCLSPATKSMPHGAYHLPRPAQITAAAAPRCKLHYLQSDASRRRRQRGLCATWRDAQIARGVCRRGRTSSRTGNLLIRE